MILDNADWAFSASLLDDPDYYVADSGTTRMQCESKVGLVAPPHEYSTSKIIEDGKPVGRTDGQASTND
jgi:hypothetical protein